MKSKLQQNGLLTPWRWAPNTAINSKLFFDRMRLKMINFTTFTSCHCFSFTLFFLGNVSSYRAENKKKVSVLFSRERKSGNDEEVGRNVVTIRRCFLQMRNVSLWFVWLVLLIPILPLLLCFVFFYCP